VRTGSTKEKMRRLPSVSPGEKKLVQRREVDRISFLFKITVLIKLRRSGEGGLQAAPEVQGSRMGRGRRTGGRHDFGDFQLPSRH